MEKIQSKLRKSGKNGTKTTKNQIKQSKTEGNEMKLKSLKEQKAELEKKNPELLKKTRQLASNGTKTNKGGDKMNARTTAEKVLTSVCKELKLTAPKRLNAKGDSKSGLGAFQAIDKSGGTKVSVRSNDVIAYCPQSYLGYGRQHPGRWVHVTILNPTDPNLEKAFRKALKDTKSGAEWARELSFIPRTQGSPINAEDKIKKLKAEIKELEAAKKTVAKRTKKKTTTKTKVSKKSASAIDKVASPATV